jgi:DNA-binding GntR family transcriptional regulator
VTKNTLTDKIVSQLTQDIVSKRLAPGEALDEMRLGQRFGASRTPIREALRQLSASGLVELRPHRAPLIMATDLVQLRDMFDVMAELEALCAMRSCTRMTAQQRHELDAHHRAMAVAVRDGDVEAYRQGNVTFHAILYEGAHSPYLKHLALGTRQRLAPHRGVQLEAPARIAQSYAEHDEIVSAILRGDEFHAGEAIRKHLMVTQETLSEMAAEKEAPKK